MRDYILDDIIYATEDCDKHEIDYLDLVLILKDKCKDIAEEHHICLECDCYKEVKEWDEYHPYGDTYSPEHWVSYHCPMCGKED